MFYAFGLMISGALAFQASGMNKNAMSSIYVGNGGALICILLAAGMRNPKLKKGEAGYKLMMICVHVAIVFPLILGAIVAWRLSLAWNVPEKAYLKPYLSAIIAISILACIGVVLNKPKKNEATASSEEKAKTS